MKGTISRIFGTHPLSARLMGTSLLILSLSACASDTPPPPPAPPPAPAGPAISLSTSVSDAAATYVAYVNIAKNITPEFKDAESIQNKLQQGASFEPKQLARGAVAYGAIVAMQEPSFRSALRGYASDSQARADLVQKIYANPAYAAGLPGAQVAARRVILGLSSDGEAIYQAGSRVKQSAYDIQRQAWSREFIKARDERLARTKVNSTTLQSVSQDQSSALLAAALDGSGLMVRATTGAMSTQDAAADAAAVTNPAAQALSEKQAASIGTMGGQFDQETLFNLPYTPAVNNALAIAALAILGEGSGQNEDLISHLLDDGTGPSCLGLSKLNLYQCLSVAKPHYEDVFCIGQHELMDTGQCLGKMSSYALTADKAAKVQADMNQSSDRARAYLAPETPKSKGKKSKAGSKSGAKSSDKAPSKAASKKKKA